jgi:CubicO group peptidase (beta-lactamase class C family)
MELRDEKISSYLTERIDAGDFPSAVYLVAEHGAIRLLDAVGLAVRTPELIASNVDTIYDLASLTKPLITGLLCARRIEQGVFGLDDPVAQFLPEFDREDKRAITLGQLLTHSSGFTPWKPLYLLADGERERSLDLIAAEELEYEPGTAVRYSDLGFIVLGKLLSRLAGEPLDELARREIFAPLGLLDTDFTPMRDLQYRIAASEKGNGFEREKAVGMGLDTDGYPWREQTIWGEVHDGNAHFLNGIAGHAGLFSTARETLRIAQQFIASSSELLAPETCARFSVDLTPGLDEARSIGWQLAATPESAAGPRLPAETFGHLGFTGTSCWIDAARERIYILLTNRTHDHPLPFVLINHVRRTFHTLATASLGAELSTNIHE